MENQKNKISNSKVRHIVMKLLLDAGIHKPPVILNTIVQHLKKSYRLSVVAWELGEKPSGIQATINDEIFIGYNKNHHPNRQRFTVAHEIGHLIMGHTSVNNNPTPENKDIEEMEANQFAAELLMPLEFIKKDIDTGLKDVPLIAKKYNVSEEMTWRRLMGCKLINRL